LTQLIGKLKLWSENSAMSIVSGTNAQMTVIIRNTTKYILAKGSIFGRTCSQSHFGEVMKIRA